VAVATEVIAMIVASVAKAQFFPLIWAGYSIRPFLF
jgi:hypothetical protein